MLFCFSGDYQNFLSSTKDDNYWIHLLQHLHKKSVATTETV